MYRRKPLKPLEPLTEAELVLMIVKNNKMKELSRICREINESGGGVVTVVELDDILRLLYEEELEGRDLTAIFEPFIHIHNKILINYKNFREAIVPKVHALEAQLGMTNPNPPIHTAGKTNESAKKDYGS